MVNMYTGYFDNSIVKSICLLLVWYHSFASQGFT